MTNAPIPFQRSYWVVPGKLLAGCYPGSPERDEERAKLSGLLDCGIRLIVNLMEEDETDHAGNGFVPYQPVLLRLALNRGLEVRCVRHPIRDLGVPSRSGMIEVLNTIDASISKGLPLYIHCWGGVGRTGSVVGCYLARHGISNGLKTLKTIQDLRRNDPTSYRPSPETHHQRHMVTSWQIGE